MRPGEVSGSMFDEAVGSPFLNRLYGLKEKTCRSLEVET
jgi:hypothetical protein